MFYIIIYENIGFVFIQLLIEFYHIHFIMIL